MIREVIRGAIREVIQEVIRETIQEVIRETIQEGVLGVTPEATPEMVQGDTPGADRVTTLVPKEAAVTVTMSLSCNKHINNDRV